MKSSQLPFSFNFELRPMSAGRVRGRAAQPQSGAVAMRALFITLLFTARAFANDTNVFQPYQIVSFTNVPPMIEASKAASITNGITLGQVVTNLGSGWMPRNESVGIIRWSFSDGRQLYVRSQSYSAGEVLGTNTSGQARFWFITNANIISPK